MKRGQVTGAAFALALALFCVALPLSIVKGTVVSGSWLTILWTAVCVSFLIGVLSLSVVWNRARSVIAWLPIELRRKQPQPDYKPLLEHMDKMGADLVDLTVTPDEDRRPGQDESQPTKTPSPLRSKLEAKHKEGTGYLRLLQPSGQMVAVATFGRHVSSEDLNVWHTEVEELLKPHPNLLRAYHHEPLQPLALQQAELIAGFAYGGPEGARMRRALRQLTKVIELC